ncbi:MAG: hypothetical protein OEW18_03975 [Candidatus Aminicenantes bacterium]|nr:hypothetical protein [Candidatus Aminicenantes bacterium]
MIRIKGTARARSLAWALPLFVLLVAGSCKWGVPVYTLTVSVGDGITGTPETGQYAYEELTAINIEYTPVNPLHTVEVFLNGTTRRSGSSSFMIYRDGYTLTSRLVDIRGSYKVTLTFSDTTIEAPAPFIITVSGPDLVSGTFTDDRGYHGTWSTTETSLTLAYWDWEFYVLSTTAFDIGYNAGMFTGGGLSGTWTAEKQ